MAGAFAGSLCAGFAALDRLPWRWHGEVETVGEYSKRASHHRTSCQFNAGFDCSSGDIGMYSGSLLTRG